VKCNTGSRGEVPGEGKPVIRDEIIDDDDDDDNKLSLLLILLLLLLLLLLILLLLLPHNITCALMH